jgi:hypothetical protein
MTFPAVWLNHHAGENYRSPGLFIKLALMPLRGVKKKKLRNVF